MFLGNERKVFSRKMVSNVFILVFMHIYKQEKELRKNNKGEDSQE